MTGRANDPSGGPGRHRRPPLTPHQARNRARNRARHRVPGHPWWVGHYQVRTRTVHDRRSHVLVMRVGRTRLLLWRLACRARDAALSFWRSLYVTGDAGPDARPGPRGRR